MQNIVIKYKTEDNEIKEVSLVEIANNIGFDHGIPSNVLDLKEDSSVLQIKVGSVVVYDIERIHA